MEITSKKKQMKSIFWVFFIGLSVVALISQSFGQQKVQKKYGNYYIGQDFSEIASGLSEMSSAEYAALKTFLKDGKIYHGKDIEYVDTKWTTVLGVKENKVYKLYLQTSYTGKDKDIWHQAFHDLIREYGFSLDQEKMGQSSLTSWNTEWGSVVLDRKIIKGETVVDITFTKDLSSRKLRNATTEGPPDKAIPKTQAQLSVDSLTKDLPSRKLRNAATEGPPDRAMPKTEGQLSVDSLIAALKDDPSPNIRMNAAKELGKMKDKLAVEPLCETLEDKSLSVRIQVIYALGALGETDDRAIECLITAFKDKDIGYIAGDSLARMGEPAVKALTEALKDPEIKERVVDLLGSIGKRATPSGEPVKARGHVIELLCIALRDENPGVRERAARELGEIKDLRAVEPLSAALNDSDEIVRDQAAGALKKIGEPAVETLIVALRNPRSDVRMNAAKALGEIHDERAIEPIGALLNDKDSIVRGYASEILGKMGKSVPEKLTGKLIEDLKDQDPSKRAGAAEALGGIKDARAVEPLIIALKDQDQRVRMNAASTLGKMKDARAVEALIAVLNDPVDEVQIYATLALAKIGDPALKPLIAALKDRNTNVQFRAAKALGAIKDFRAVEPLIEVMKNNLGLPSQEAGRALLNITGEHFGNRPEEWQKWWDQVKEKHLEKVKD